MDSDKDMDNIAIGKRLRQIRMYYGYDNQSAFARDHGWKQSIYSHWENGRRSPTFKQLKPLCDKGWTLDFIYLGRLDALSHKRVELLKSRP